MTQRENDRVPGFKPANPHQTRKIIMLLTWILRVCGFGGFVSTPTWGRLSGYVYIGHRADRIRIEMAVANPLNPQTRR